MGQLRRLCQIYIWLFSLPHSWVYKSPLVSPWYIDKKRHILEVHSWRAAVQIYEILLLWRIFYNGFGGLCRVHLKHTSNPGLAQMNALNWDFWSTLNGIQRISPLDPAWAFSDRSSWHSLMPDNIHNYLFWRAEISLKSEHMFWRPEANIFKLVMRHKKWGN